MNTDKLREEFEMWMRNHARRENRSVREDEIADWWLSRTLSRQEVAEAIEEMKKSYEGLTKDIPEKETYNSALTDLKSKLGLNEK